MICGISGQDGAYLAKFLLAKYYDVYATFGDAEMSTFSDLDRLEILAEVETLSITIFGVFCMS